MKRQPLFTFIDLFAGIGGIRLGLQRAGGRCVYSSEWDKAACDTYEANFGHRPAGDITKVDAADIPDHDLLAAGFPCQPFSIAGHMKGFADTRGTLFFEIERILRERRPKAVLLENVKQFRTHDDGRTCETVMKALTDLGYRVEVKVLNAFDFGLPQLRERTIIVGLHGKGAAFEWPKPAKRRKTLEDILEDYDGDCDPELSPGSLDYETFQALKLEGLSEEEQYDKLAAHEGRLNSSLYASQDIVEKRLARLKEQGKTPFYPSIWHENKGGHISVNPYSCALRRSASYNYLLVDGKRRLSSRELLRLQGFPDSFRIRVSHSAIRNQTGNSVAVPVIAAVAKKIVDCMRIDSGQMRRLPRSAALSAAA